MKTFSLKKKVLFLVFVIAMVCPVVSGIIYLRNSSTVSQFKSIVDNSLPRTRQMGAVLSGFRQLRIEVRSLAIRGNTQKDFDLYLKNITSTIVSLTEEKNKLMKMMVLSDEERVMSEKIETAWKKFEALGKEIISLYNKGDEESLNKMAELVRVSCPEIANEFDAAVADMSERQRLKDAKLVEEALAHSEFTTLISFAIALVGVICALLFGGVFSSKIVETMKRTIQDLSRSSQEINNKTGSVGQISTNLSSSTVQQAASLQETVASLTEISAMVARNAESAQTSVVNSEQSTMAVNQGKEKVGLMISSIKDIADGNNELMDKMQKSNAEITEIVTVIEDIARKTEVINDIVFQTKLLSFNASVEAARAGEHGKGFAVVAEEIGNLAAMSGNAAHEISDMLTTSVNRVSGIVEGTKTMMNSLMKRSAEKIDLGNETARECSEAFNLIQKNVSAVNELLIEISTASIEQSQGIKEINKAMNELDQVTQQNSGYATDSSQTATELNNQVEKLNTIVIELSGFIEGRKARSA